MQRQPWRDALGAHERRLQVRKGGAGWTPVTPQGPAHLPPIHPDDRMRRAGGRPVHGVKALTQTTWVLVPALPLTYKLGLHILICETGITTTIMNCEDSMGLGWEGMLGAWLMVAMKLGGGGLTREGSKEEGRKGKSAGQKAAKIALDSASTQPRADGCHLFLLHSAHSMGTVSPPPLPCTKTQAPPTALSRAVPSAPSPRQCPSQRMTGVPPSSCVFLSVWLRSAQHRGQDAGGGLTRKTLRPA